MPAPKITVYLDIVSPFAYIAFHILKNSPTFAGCEITYIPIFLGGLMNACGNSPPITIKNKDKWINVERLRWAKYFSVPMADKVPDGFPIRTLNVQRALCALSQNCPAKVPAVLEALFRSTWVDRNSQIGEADGFAAVLEPVVGKDITQDVISSMGQPHVKSLLTSNTEQAFKDGAFGLPWFVCTNAKGETEGYWGVDHIGQVADFLVLDRGRDIGFKAVL